MESTKHCTFKKKEQGQENVYLVKSACEISSPFIRQAAWRNDSILWRVKYSKSFFVVLGPVNSFVFLVWRLVSTGTFGRKASEITSLIVAIRGSWTALQNRIKILHLIVTANNINQLYCSLSASFSTSVSGPCVTDLMKEFYKKNGYFFTSSWLKKV